MMPVSSSRAYAPGEFVGKSAAGIQERRAADILG